MPEEPLPTDDTAHRWDLGPVYADDSAWEEALEEIGAGVDALKAFRGTLDRGAARLRDCLRLYFATLKTLHRASSYASMRHHEDMREPRPAAMEQRAGLLSTALCEAASFIEPEVLQLGRERVAAFLAEEAGLDPYRHPLDDILRRAEHTRSPAEEEIIATAGLVTEAPHDTYGILANADTAWPTVQLASGDKVRLDQPAFVKYRSATDREDRRLVFDTFWGVWKGYERTYGMMLYSQLKRDLFYSRVRRYPSCLAAALDADRIPERVYRTLIAEAGAHLAVLGRYFRLRARLLELPELHYYDIYPPLVRTDRMYPIGKAKDLTLAALAALGEECTSVTEAAFAERWIDVFPRPGKRAGAYMNGHVFDVHPFVLLNYNGDYDSVSTLAHEWGHALHSHLANRSQPFATAQYSIFLAEIASTLAEALLLESMLRQVENPSERLFYLGHALEQLRGTFFRQAMFSEFELAIHERVEEGEALTGSDFSRVYGELLRRYHGHDEGVVHIADAHTVEWAYIPHFYYGFYVYQYATSVAASSLLVERLLSGQSGALDSILDLLRAGGNGYPYDLLCAAGVDLAREEPYRALMRRMESIMDEIEEALAES